MEPTDDTFVKSLNQRGWQQIVHCSLKKCVDFIEGRIDRAIAKLVKGQGPIPTLLANEFADRIPNGDALDMAWWLEHDEGAPREVRRRVSDLTGYDRIETETDAIDASKVLSSQGDDALAKLAFLLIRCASSMGG